MEIVNSIHFAGVLQKVEHQTIVFAIVCCTCDIKYRNDQSKNTKIGSVYVFLDARTPMANSELLLVKILVILRGKQFRVDVKLYSTSEIVNKAMIGKGTIPKDAKALKDEINVYVKKAEDIIEQFPTADKKCSAIYSNLKPH